MNGYLLSRQWFDFAFENPEKVTPMQGCLYMWLIEINNRKGFSEKFNFNTDDACAACGCNNRKTVWKALNELVEFGFVSIIFKSDNRHKPTVISIINNRILSNGCLDKSLTYLSDNWTGKETVDGLVDGSVSGSVDTLVSGHSYKQINKETKKHILASFDTFWEMYGKKEDRRKCEKKWVSIDEKLHEKILTVLPAYIAKTPELKFRKNPLTWLNGECWNDEVVVVPLFENKQSQHQPLANNEW
jgi:hypothetical protein